MTLVQLPEHSKMSQIWKTKKSKFKDFQTEEIHGYKDRNAFLVFVCWSALEHQGKTVQLGHLTS